MKHHLILACIFLLTGLTGLAQEKDLYKATFIESRSWMEAKALLTDTTIVILPLGAEAKEHGPHLQLNNDWLIADYLTKRIAKDQPVVIYPPINYSFYPAFLEYAGSTSIRMETAYSMITDICRVISAHGPRKFYVLNTGVSTLAPLKVAREILVFQGIRMEYTDILHVAGDAEKKIKQQSAGTHADEIETSMMLYMYPATVDMTKAAKDIPSKDEPGPLSLDPSSARYSATGIYGDATLATREKGRVVVEAMVAGINKEIDALRRSAVPLAVANKTIQLMTGTYILTGGDKVIITMKGSELVFERMGRKVPLRQQTDNAFTIGERGRVVFFRGENGEYSTLYLNLEGLDYLGRK